MDEAPIDAAVAKVTRSFHDTETAVAELRDRAFQVKALKWKLETLHSAAKQYADGLINKSAMERVLEDTRP